MKFKIFLLLLGGVLLSGLARGQTATPVVLNSVGGSADINIGSIQHIEYSVGEVFTQTFDYAATPAIIKDNTPQMNNVPSTHFTAGVLQPTLEGPYYVLPTKETFDDSFAFRCFPVPTSDLLTVETNYPDFTRADFTDLLGRRVLSAPFDYAPLDCRALPAGTYLVRLSSENQPIFKTFKLIKQ